MVPVPEAVTMSPTDVASRLRLATTRLARRLRQQSDADLTPTQTAFLATIGNRGPLPVGALAAEEHVTAPTATKIVDKLHEAGLVARTALADDRRVTQVALTPAGQRLLAELRAAKTAWLARRLTELPADDLARLTAALDVLEGLTAPPGSDGP
jgi:DNA-binding MarR family transcriptional regulator